MSIQTLIADDELLAFQDVADGHDSRVTVGSHVAEAAYEMRCHQLLCNRCFEDFCYGLSVHEIYASNPTVPTAVHHASLLI